MKLLKLTISALCLYLFLFAFSAPFAGCMKEIIRDTTIVRDTTVLRDTTIVRDTTIIRDTTVIRDTLRIHDKTECNNIAHGLIAYYHFDNGSLQDASGFNNHIYYNSATVTADRFGRPNNAYLFDGDNSYMSIKNSASLNPKNISFVATIKINRFNTRNCENNAIISKGWNDYINGFYFLRFKDINSDCSSATPAPTNKEIFSGGFGDLSTRSAVEADTSFLRSEQWYNVVYTFDGYESRLYLDGELKKVTLGRAQITPNTYDLLLGRHGDPANPYHFGGIIDEIRIYDRALCFEQVKKLNELSKNK